MNAERNGANRIELCSDLFEDGLTPGLPLVESVLNNVNIPVRLMIRPRGGDFIYSDEELLAMKSSIKSLKVFDIEGFVFGVCTESNELDLTVIEELVDLSHPKKVTIHKAIDVCKDPVIEVRRLKNVGGVSSVLSSGKERTALEGRGLIKTMLKEAGDQIEVIVCGKVTDTNLIEVHNEFSASAYHGKLIVGSLH